VSKVRLGVLRPSSLVSRRGCEYYEWVVRVSFRLALLLMLVLLATPHVNCGEQEIAPTPTSTRTPIATPTPTPVVVLPDCPTQAEPFVIEPEESFEVAMTLDKPTFITAEATWKTGPGQLSLLLNGPDRPELTNPEAPYERRDGPSGALVLKYSATDNDIERGSDWRVRVANFENQTAAGCLKVTEEPIPIISPTPTPTPPSATGVYGVTYSKMEDSCGSFPEEFEDFLDVHVDEGTIAIHQRWTGDDSAGTISASGSFTTTGTGLTHLEVYEGSFKDGHIEAVNSFVQEGCKVKYFVSGERQ
jgi:hypothetical protein